MIYANQRNATRNQSSVDYSFSNIFLYGNRYNTGVLVNNLGESLYAQDGILVVRNSGTFETAVVAFSTTPLSAAQTVILAGLTYTSTGVTTQAQLAAAFANLAVGATTGTGTTTGTYSGTLTGYATGAVTNVSKVVFTASTVGPKTDLAATGTGAAPTITVVNGTAGVDEGFSPATSATLANVIGVLKINGLVTLADTASTNANYALCGDIDAGLLVLPLGVTLDSVVGSKALKDILTALGFVLKNVTELSKFGN
jgi:hypothetical protein